MEREVIVVYTTEEDDENLDPNEQTLIPPSSTGAFDTNATKTPCEARSPVEHLAGSVSIEVAAPLPHTVASVQNKVPDKILAVQDDVTQQTSLGPSAPRKTPPQKTTDVTASPRTSSPRTSTPGSEHTISFSIPSSERAPGRPLKQLLIVGATSNDAGPEKRRRSEPDCGRQARPATVQLRPLYRAGQIIRGHNIPSPPPLRPARVKEAVAMSNHTHMVACAGERLEPAEAPTELPSLGLQFNPDNIKFQDVAPTKMCRCKHLCRVDSCDNAEQHFFCTPYCCPFDGACGNGLDPSRCLALMQNDKTKDYTVVAAHPIDAHVVVGEYLGRMRLETFAADERPRNGGFRLYMHHDLNHPAGARVRIDSEVFGNMLRYVNHSCFPNARFRQVGNGTVHTVVIVTNRRLERDEELLVDYGNELWFFCLCDDLNCRHQGFRKELDSTDYAGDADDEMEEALGSAAERKIIREAITAGAKSDSLLRGGDERDGKPAARGAAAIDANDGMAVPVGGSDSDFE